jgi:hypothetical protein
MREQSVCAAPASDRGGGADPELGVARLATARTTTNSTKCSNGFVIWRGSRERAAEDVSHGRKSNE